MSNSSTSSSKILFKNILVGFLAFIRNNFFFSEINSFLLDIINNVGKIKENLNGKDAINFFKSIGKVKKLLSC